MPCFISVLIFSWPPSCIPNKGEDYLNRTKLPSEFKGPYYATKITADYRHTQGGLVISPETEVLKADGTSIPHLYAGGGVTEGFSSNGDSNYMAGNGLLQAFVYGRIAGQSAAKDVTSAVNADEFRAQAEELEAISNAISGATMTSQGIFDAVDNALETAK